jgi:hypothetical protein
MKIWRRNGNETKRNEERKIAINEKRSVNDLGFEERE